MSLTDRLSSLTPEQRAALEVRLRQRMSSAEGSRIGRRADAASRQLSFAQERLWFVEQLLPAGAANHIAGAVRFEGALSIAALERALGEILRRHEVLRTACVDEHGRPAARLIDVGSVEIRRRSLSGTSGDARERELRRLAQDEAERPFDLATDPLLRASLIEAAPDDHVLVLVLHHIAADGWSLGVLVRELGALYDALVAGRAPDLPELPIQYADYAEWQRQRMSGTRLAEGVEWWRQRLEGVPVLEVPTDRPRTGAPSVAGARAHVAIPAGVMTGIARVAQRHDATTFMAMLAAFQVLMARWSSQLDVAIGSPVAGRDHSELEPLIGLFVNTVVFRGDLSGDPAFADLLARTRETVGAALAHQDVPFEKLVEELRVERSLSHTPLTPVVFALQNVPTAAMALSGLRVSTFEFERTTSRFDLCLFVVEGTGGATATMEYRSDLFEASTIHRMLDAYVRLLEGIAADPRQRIGSLPLLDETARHQIVTAWNDTARDYPRESTIPELVAAQAARRPGTVAVACGAERLTYGQLESKATQLARLLAAAGVKPGARVGVAVERSTDLVVALLGILKAGGAYVALDPVNPESRLEYMARNAGIEVIVAHSASAGETLRRDRVVIDLDRQGVLDAAPPGGPGAVISPHDLAYVSYTSGSTGEPKGVEVSHRAVLRLLCNVDYVRLGPDETLLHLAPLAFDASTLEIWGALLHGGRLVVYPQAVPDFEELGRTLAAEAVTTLWLTASLYNAVVDHQPAMLAGVRQLLTGGEALSIEHVRRGLAALPRTTIVNGYGPTEATTFTCCHTIQESDVAAGAGSIPIGRPIANTRVYILDRHLEPVPLGVPGELYVGGDGLARGYAGAARMTAERFVPDAFSGVPGSRLYRTGDLARYRPDGTIEFLGRRDSQVKVRGYRIELGEIEAELSRHPAVAAAAVIVRQDGVRKAIVAYLVETSSSDDGDLRAFLKRRLPDYMLPSAFVRLAALPLTANGKIDRDALPAVDVEDAAGHDFVAPRNEVEEVVVETCRELLKLPRVGVFDNFFDLGGHSLVATQFASRLRRAFDVDVSVRAIFEASTLAELSDGIVERLLGE